MGGVIGRKDTAFCIDFVDECGVFCLISFSAGWRLNVKEQLFAVNICDW